ncbi:MAG: energy transducer TonB [Bacteroidales bacterium]|nr:energy transducer TonB [Bacteroidales bacterium]
MITKKTDRGNLDNKRTLFLLLGFVVVLGLVYAGFELFANEEKAAAFQMPDDDFIEVKDEDVIATDQTPPPPPEPVQQQQAVVLNIVEDNIKVSTDFDFSQDVFQDDAIAEIEEEVEVVEEETDATPPVYFTEEMPEFPGGMEALNSFLTKEIQYPEVARNNGITGTVLVEFVVERDGRVSNAKVKVPLYPDCDKEAVRGIMAMPKWKPGKNMGKPVRCFYQVPVTFRM